MKWKKLCFLLAFAALPWMGQGQELNARVTVNSDKIQGTNKSVFTTLQTSLMEFINNRKWTDATFAINERIDCTMTIIVNEQEDNTFSAEIQVPRAGATNREHGAVARYMERLESLR